MYTFKINPVTPQQFQEKKEEIVKNGLTITPNNNTTHVAEGDIKGSVLGFDIELGYRYDGGTLEVDVIKKPFVASNGKVESKVRECFA